MTETGKQVQLGLRVPERIKEALQKKAEETGRPMRDIVIEAIEYELGLRIKSVPTPHKPQEVPMRQLYVNAPGRDSRGKLIK